MAWVQSWGKRSPKRTVVVVVVVRGRAQGGAFFGPFWEDWRGAEGEERGVWIDMTGHTHTHTHTDRASSHRLTQQRLYCAVLFVIPVLYRRYCSWVIMISLTHVPYSYCAYSAFGKSHLHILFNHSFGTKDKKARVSLLLLMNEMRLYVQGSLGRRGSWSGRRPTSTPLTLGSFYGRRLARLWVVLAR